MRVVKLTKKVMGAQPKLVCGWVVMNTFSITVDNDWVLRLTTSLTETMVGRQTRNTETSKRRQITPGTTGTFPGSDDVTTWEWRVHSFRYTFNR